jgi:hypothetical protein
MSCILNYLKAGCISHAKGYGVQLHVFHAEPKREMIYDTPYRVRQNIYTPITLLLGTCRHLIRSLFLLSLYFFLVLRRSCFLLSLAAYVCTPNVTYSFRIYI